MLSVYKNQPLVRFSFCLLTAAILLGCNDRKSDKASTNEAKPLFTLLSPDSTNITFTNNLNESLNTNVLMYEYFYNGAGVAVGDVNGDNLEDIYFVSNMGDNKLYLNKGALKFEDITAAAGVQNSRLIWKTGVTIADVNGDHREDIYVSYSGKVRGENRVSELFINDGTDSKGIPHFSEQAERYGLADTSFKTQVFFFDYDRDGDLDMLSLNHNPNNLPVLDVPSTKSLLSEKNTAIGLRLFANNNNHFDDITDKTGLSSSALSYGLGAGIADINMDGWPDIYVSNDYSVPDYMYINNKNGTFTDKLQSSLGHTSKSSMGNNVSDINNDGLPDIFVLDMLPESNQRQKLLFAPDNYEKFSTTLQSGFYYQYMKNVLQLNNGDGTFSEVAEASGLSNTDWSWAPLFADYDNDGWKDLFVTNGYLRDYTNMDFLKYMNDYIQQRGRLNRNEILEILKQMPASNVNNYMFKNRDGISFDNVGAAWGINVPSNSNGAAYADLDNDGDLDLVVNNIDAPAFVYRNESSKQSKNNYLKIKLAGEGMNTDGLGAKVFLYNKNKLQYLEQMPARGFQSTVSSILHFGLGENSSVDSLRVVWLSGKQQLLTKVKAAREITLDEKDAAGLYTLPAVPKPLFEEVASPVPYANASVSINDFKRQPLLLNPLSFFGPCLAKGDANGDGLEDVYAGGGAGQPGGLYLQTKGGQFVLKTARAFEQDKQCEDADAVFFDANGDGFPDLYVASGGYHNLAPDDSLLQDRLYLNDGKANYTLAKDALPKMLFSKSCVRVSDFNGDGYPDLFVGGRTVPGQYPQTPESYLLTNNGNGHFSDQTSALAPGVKNIGMVTDAAWVDVNRDKKVDLVVVGEWMPVTVFVNVNNKLENRTTTYFDKSYGGWWNKLSVGDFNNDGKPDLMVGNEGLNTQCKVSDKEPADMFYKDFDDNGSVDPIFCFYIQHKSYPYITRDELFDQMSSMRTRFADYKTYADATMSNVFTDEELHGAKHLQANYLQTALFESGSDGKFHLKPLPMQAQFSPVFTVTQLDYDKDGAMDVLLCGNINQAKLKVGKADANYGVLLHNDGKGNFQYVNQRRSGFHIWGDVRSVINLNNTLLFGINQKPAVAYKLK